MPIDSRLAVLIFREDQGAVQEQVFEEEAGQQQWEGQLLKGIGRVQGRGQPPPPLRPQHLTFPALCSHTCACRGPSIKYVGGQIERARRCDILLGLHECVHGCHFNTLCPCKFSKDFQ